MVIEKVAVPGYREIHPEDRKNITDYVGVDLSKGGKKEAVQFAMAHGFKETGMSHNEIALMFDLLEKQNPRTIVELGRNHGCSTRLFLHHIFRNGGYLDSWDLKHFYEFYAAMEKAGIVLHTDRPSTFGAGGYTIRKAHSMKEDMPQPIASNGIDFLLIDTEHAIDDALGEYMRFRPYLNPGSLAVFHDSTLPAVARAIELVKEVENWGSRRNIVREYVNESIDGFGITALERAS